MVTVVSGQVIGQLNGVYSVAHRLYRRTADNGRHDNGRQLKPNRHVAACAAVVAVCLAVTLPTVSRHSYFLGDDFGLVHHLHDLPLSRVFSYFVSDWTESIYGFELDELRPLLAFTYWLDSHAWGVTNAPAYHITNIALHVLNSLLVFAIARAIAPARTDVALLASCLFALMPSHAEPIAWISGRVDSLAAVFYLGAFLCFLCFRRRQSPRWWVAALVLFAFGLFAKQSVVTFPVLILAYDAVYQPRLRSFTPRALVSRYLLHVPFVVVVALYLALRHTLFGNAVRESALTGDAVRSFLSRQTFYIGELLPVPPDISAGATIAVQLFIWGVLAGCTLWLVARWRRDHDILRHLFFFGPMWYAITIIPMIVTYASARHLYLTAAGLSIALASLLLPAGWRSEARTTAVRGVAVGVLLILSAAALTSSIRGWIANGADSRRFAETLPVLLQSLPPGSTVMVDIPDVRRGVWFWSWVFPFVLQQPYVRDDLYKQFAIVEWPIVYCCPPGQWWAAKQRALGPILQSTGTHQLTYIVPDERDPGSLILVKRTVNGAALRTRIESAIGRPVETFATSITQDEAQRIAAILFK